MLPGRNARLSTQSSVCKRGVEADVQDSQPGNYTSDEQIQLVRYFQMPSMKINLIKKRNQMKIGNYLTYLEAEKSGLDTGQIEYT